MYSRRPRSPKWWFASAALVSLWLAGAACSSPPDEAPPPSLSTQALSGPVVLSPNVIKGTVRFANVNPEILSILEREGMDTLLVRARSTVGYSSVTEHLVPENNLGGSYQLSAEANGGVGQVTYSLEAVAWVNRGARSGSPGLGDGNYGFGLRSVTLRPVEVQPEGVTQNFSETVGVVRIRFGTDTSCATPAPILTARVNTHRGFTNLNGARRFSNYSMGYYLMPGGETLTAKIEITTGTREDLDTITFVRQVEFHAGPDEIQDVCIPIPQGDGGSLGAIVTPFQVMGHEIVPRASSIWARSRQGTLRYTLLTGTTGPEQPSSTWPRLPNLVPDDYVLWTKGLLGWGDRQIKYSTNGSGPAASGYTAVLPGQDVDAKQSFADGSFYPFVFRPAHFNGSIRLYDRYVENHPEAPSSLSRLTFHTLWPITSPDRPGGTARGPDGGTTLRSSVGGSGSSATSFPDRFQAAQGQLAGTYSLPIISLFDRPSLWPVPRLNLMYASEPRTIIGSRIADIHYDYEYHFYYMHPRMASPDTYRMGTLTLTQQAPLVTVRPGQEYSRDHHYCFNEVRLQYVSRVGSFVNPVASVEGGFEGVDFEGNAARYTGKASFQGTPAVGFYQPEDVYLEGRASEGAVSFALPQGTWKITAGATFVNADGTSSSGNFPGVELTVGCGQRVEPLPGLSVSFQLEAACQQGNAATVKGTVNSGSAPIDRIWYKLNDQLFELCTANCDKDFSFDVPQAYAGAAITVYASSSLVPGEASASDTLPQCAPPEPDCIQVRLSDYNLFLLGDYSGGHDVQGRVAAGGTITLSDFSVGAGVPASGTANTLVAGENLRLSRGAVWGDAWYGNQLSSNSSVVFPRGGVAQGSPVDFAARGAALRGLSTRLAGLPAQGEVTLQPWGGVMLRGTDPHLNVFRVNASAFSGAKLLSIDAPAGSLAVINISGGTATFTGFGHSFSGGIDQRGVLFNFVDTTAINAHHYGFWGTVLAPYAHVNFSHGSFDGGIYASSMEGNAEGHINRLEDRDICLDTHARP